ncbi:MAG: hypothetical protein ACMVY4_18200 [Minwuia sp.]|uniref:hypothetical protein n=1 Tax=Minwuia sp. TaxID=2493630 RepID=UPI003A8C84BF
MGATITYVMLAEDPRKDRGDNGTLYYEVMVALEGYVGRHMQDLEPEDYLKSNHDPSNPPEPVEPQVWRMTADQAVYELRLRDGAAVPDEPTLNSLAAELNRTAAYVGEEYRIEDDLIVGSSPYNPEWKFNSFDVGGRFVDLFTEIHVDDWPREQAPCANCDGKGEIPPESFVLPRALRLTAAARNANDNATPCPRCGGKGYRTLVEPPPPPEDSDPAFSPDQMLKILNNGTEAAEPQAFVDLRGTWQYLPVKMIEDEDGRRYGETDLTLFKAALSAAPPGTIVVPIEHDGG